MEPKAIRLSVCIIVKDEAERLPVAIESVKPIADEIVVVDTGSTDDSVPVAESLGARVVRMEWREDFSEARNTSIEAAEGDWILCIDADEYVPKESQDEIIAAIGSDGDAYFVRIESKVSCGVGKSFVNFFPRLFRKMDGARFEGRVHEQIFPRLERAGADVRVSGIVIKHTGYDLSPAALAGKARRNAELLYRELDSRPGDALLLFHLGEAHSMMDEYDKAVSFYERSLDAGELPKEIMGPVYQNLGSALVKQQRYDDALVRLRSALEIDPGLLTAHLVIAASLFGMGKYDRAEAELAIFINKSRHVGGSRRLKLGYEPEIAKALILLAKCRLAKGDLEGAAEALNDALKMDRSLGDAHILLGKIAFEELRFNQAVVHLEEALELGPKDERLYYELARAYVACGSTDKAISKIEDALTAGFRGPDLLKCLGVLKIKTKDFEGAIRAYDAALALDSTDAESRRRLAGLHHLMGNDDAARQYINAG